MNDLEEQIAALKANGEQLFTVVDAKPDEKRERKSFTILHVGHTGAAVLVWVGFDDKGDPYIDAAAFRDGDRVGLEALELLGTVNIRLQSPVPEV